MWSKTSTEMYDTTSPTMHTIFFVDNTVALVETKSKKLYKATNILAMKNNKNADTEINNPIYFQSFLIQILHLNLSKSIGVVSKNLEIISLILIGSSRSISLSFLNSGFSIGNT